MSYEVVPATEAHVEELSRTMRKPDRDECWAVAHLTPRRALDICMAVSPAPMAGLANGELVTLFGVQHRSVLSGIGQPWLLTADNVTKHGIMFASISKEWVAKLRDEFDYLTNVVDARHRSAIRWLQWLGFSIGPAACFGPDDEAFHVFEMKVR